MIAFRILNTIVVLYFVWQNSHWSVALALTMLSINSELNDAIRREGKRK